MTLRKIDHIGIAVRSLAAALPFYEGVLGLRCERREEIASQGVRVAFLPIGGIRLELLEPTSPASPIARFLETRGEGIHHIAYESDGIVDDLAAARAAGTRLIHETPFAGGHDMLVAFLHPKSTFGVLTEFCTRQNENK